MENGKINFTQTLIAKLPHPTSGKKIYWDSVRPNLGIRVTKSAKTFFVRFKHLGRSYERAIEDRIKAENIEGDKGFILAHASIAQVRDEAETLMSLLKSNADPRETRKKELELQAQEKAASITLEDALTAYLAEVPLKERTQMDYRALMTRELLPYCNLQLKDIDRQAAEAMIHEIKDRLIETGRGKNGSRANHAVRLVRALCLFHAQGCQDWRARRRRKFPWVKTAPRTTDLDPSMGHGQELWQLLEQSRSDTSRDYVKALMLSGARRGELADARVSDVNLKTKTITLRDTKNGLDHKILMSEQLTRIVTEAIKDKGPDQPIFSHCGEPKKLMANLSKKIGVHVTCHNLRKLFALSCMHLNISYPALKGCLNHTPGSADVTHAHYARPSPAMLRDAWQAVADLYAPPGAEIIHLDHHRKSA